MSKTLSSLMFAVLLSACGQTAPTSSSAAKSQPGAPQDLAIAPASYACGLARNLGNTGVSNAYDVVLKVGDQTVTLAGETEEASRQIKAISTQETPVCAYGTGVPAPGFEGPVFVVSSLTVTERPIAEVGFCGQAEKLGDTGFPDARQVVMRLGNGAILLAPATQSVKQKFDAIAPGSSFQACATGRQFPITGIEALLFDTYTFGPRSAPSGVSVSN